MSSRRGGYGGIAIVFLIAVVAVALLALSAAGSAAAGVPGTPAPTGARPPVLTGAQIPSQYRLHIGGAVPLTGLGSTPTPASRFDSGPGPTDLPFAPNVAVWTDPAPQTRPTEGRDTMGRTYVAFQHEVSPTNHDLYVAWSDDDGATWSAPVAVANTAADETNPNLIVTVGDRLTVFFQQDGNQQAFAYAYSTNRGASWTIQPINTGAMLTRNEYPSFVANGAGAYGMYGTWCTQPQCVTGPNPAGAWTILMLFNPDVSSASTWQGIYFGQPSDVELFHPSSAINSGSGDLDGAIEIEIVDDTAWDLTWFRYNPTGGFFSQDGLMCGTFCPSNDFVWPSITADGNRAVTGAHFFNSNLGAANVILAVYSTNTPGGGATWQLVNANQGTIDSATVDQKYLSLDMKGTQVQAAYWKANAIWFVLGINTGATFQAPARVSDNTPATAIEVQHAVVVKNSTAAGPLVAWHDSRDGNANIYFAGLQRFTITIATNPSPLNVRFDGAATWTSSPASQRFPAGTTHTIEAQSPQPGGPGVQYLFTQWNDAVTNNPRTISINADTTYTATFVTQYQITIATNPVGRSVTVNGGPQLGPYVFWCTAGQTASLDAPSPQTVSPTSQYRYQSWSDAGAQAHGIACDQSKTVTANFVLQYQVTIGTNPAGRDVVVASVTRTGPYTFWCDDASSVGLDAPTPQATAPNTQYRFDAWSDNLPATHSITCSSSTTITANFVLQYQITIATNPAGRAVTVNGNPQTGPYAAWYDQGGNIGLLVPSPQTAGLGTRYSFSAWSDGNTTPPRPILADQPRTLTAVFTTEYFLTMSAVPVGTVSPGNGWHPADDIVPITTTGPADGLTDRYRFDRWSGDLTSFATSTTITMNAPKTLTATWVHQFKIEVQSNVNGASITVDTVPTPTPIVAWWNASSTHTLQAPASITIGSNERWNFATWTGGGNNAVFTFAVSGPATYSAQYTHQFLITLTTSPGTGPTVMVDSQPYTGAPLWWDEGTTHSLDAGSQPQSGGTGIRYVFQQWSDSTSSPAARTYSVSAAATVTATYRTQYFLTITSAYPAWSCTGAVATIATGCWFNDGDSAVVTVGTAYQSGGTKFAFTGWSGDATGSGSATVSMDQPRSITAGWREVSFVEEYGVYLGLLIAIIVAIVLILLFLMMRRKKQAPAMPAARAPAAQATQQMGGTKACPACGMEIPAGATTCPVCGSAV